MGIILEGITKENLVQELRNSLMPDIKRLFIEHRDQFTDKEYLTAKEARALLKISNVTLWNWTKRGKIKGQKVGSRLRYRRTEVMKLLRTIEPED